MVHLCKPAHTGDCALTDKTGWGNCKASVWGRTSAQAPQGNASRRKVTGGADFPTKPTCQQVWERVVLWSEGSLLKVVAQYKRLVELLWSVTQIVKYYWVVRETKGMWRVVCCRAKLYGATEAARDGRLQLAHLVEHLNVNETAVGSNPTLLYKNAKSASVVCEKHLILKTSVNWVWRSSQGEINLC